MLSALERLNGIYRHIKQTEKRLRIAGAERFKAFNDRDKLGGNELRLEPAVKMQSGKRHLHRFCVFVNSPAKFRYILCFNAKARRKRMTAEVGQKIRNAVNGVIKRKALNAPARAFGRNAVACDNHARLQIAVNKPCGNYSDYAAVPALAVKNKDAVKRPFRVLLKLLLRLKGNLLLKLLPLCVCKVNLAGNFLCALLVLTDEKLKRLVRAFKPANGVYARNNAERNAACAERLFRRSGDLAQRFDSDVFAGINLFYSAPDNCAVFPR